MSYKFIFFGLSVIDYFLYIYKNDKIMFFFPNRIFSNMFNPINGGKTYTTSRTNIYQYKTLGGQKSFVENFVHVRVCSNVCISVWKCIWCMFMWELVGVFCLCNRRIYIQREMRSHCILCSVLTQFITIKFNLTLCHMMKSTN